MPLDISRELNEIRSVTGWNWLYQALQKVVLHVNQLGENLGGDTQSLPAPPQVQSLAVKSSGSGTIHAVITDNTPIKRNIHYFLEYATDPSFANFHVMPLHTSREAILRLPGQDDGGNAQTFHFRAYSQYPGSGGPSVPVVYASGVVPGGSEKLTLLPTAGSGTATPQEGASGFGRYLRRQL